jgi:hypothetical protein
VLSPEDVLHHHPALGASYRRLPTTSLSARKFLESITFSAELLEGVAFSVSEVIVPITALISNSIEQQRESGAPISTVWRTGQIRMPRLRATQTESIDSDDVRINDDESDDTDDSIDIDDADLALLEIDAAHQMVDDLTWKLLKIDAPDWYMNPAFKVVFPERSAYDSIAACSPLTFPPNLHDVLTSSQPPSIDFFKSLPKPTGKMWAVYGNTFEKAGHKPQLYIGSGTEADYGVSARLSQYKPDDAQLPLLVREAFNRGYHLAHSGLICWTPLPSAGLVPRVRARFLALEAIFTCLFHAAREATTDVNYKHLLLWEQHTVEWEPLCTHLPLREEIFGNLDLSSEELEIIAAIRTEHKARRIKQWREAKRSKDVDAYRLHDRVIKNAWAAKNGDKVNKTAGKVRTKAKTKQRFHCDVCEMSLQSQVALDNHLATQSHANQVARFEKPEMSQYSINRKAKRAKAKANNEHRCHTCNKGFETDWALTRHTNTPSHRRKAEAQASQRVFHCSLLILIA